MSRLEQRLAQLKTEGKFDSGGCFTLDQRRALRLQHFDRHPHDFLLKLVQCAHLVGASQVQIESQKSRLEVSFEAPSLQPEHLWDQSSPAANKLLSAARAATQFHSERTLWGYCGRDLGWGQRYHQGELELESLRGTERDPAEIFLLCHLQSPLDWGEIERRCRFSRIPILHNGKPLASTLKVKGCLVDWLFWGTSAGLPRPQLEEMPARLYRLGEREPVILEDTSPLTYLQIWTGSEGLSLAPLSMARAEQANKLPPGARVLARIKAFFSKSLYYVVAPELPESPQGRLLVPALPKGIDSEVCWVQHGVTLQAQSLRLLLNQCQFFWSDPRLNVDASELALVEDEYFWERVEWLQSKIMHVRHEVRRCLNHWADQGWPKKWVIKVIEAQHLDVKD